LGTILIFVSWQRKDRPIHAPKNFEKDWIDAGGFMKKQERTMSLREAKARLSEAIDSSQGAYVLVTRHGRPAAVIIGVEGSELPDIAALVATRRGGRAA
jgi:prevent-host-death family protein